MLVLCIMCGVFGMMYSVSFIMSDVFCIMYVVRVHHGWCIMACVCCLMGDVLCMVYVVCCDMFYVLCMLSAVLCIQYHVLCIMNSVFM